MEKRYSKGFARAGCGRQIVRREQIEAHVYLPELKIDANSGAAPFQEAATAQVKTRGLKRRWRREVAATRSRQDTGGAKWFVGRGL